MAQEAEEAEWIAKWGAYERFLNFFNPGDECKIYYGRGLIYYALSIRIRMKDIGSVVFC